ncbi:insoluble domain protein (plasmid) [Prescottella equi]|uniref:insoluble domain protein n=1 Tax=Rhodococcus hoagii TaxID=43767 RepID=UPI0025775FC8|nr:insoluble domain protein [Prescottella equi]WJJ14558.1 insoluble domain protein [Prescottella equi]
MKHRAKPRQKQIKRLTVLVGSATVASLVAAGAATAAPGQPGVEADDSGQPGVIVAPEPAPETNRSYWTPPPAEYQNVEWRETPSYQQPSYNSGYNAGGYDSGYSQPYYGEPIRVEQLHLPTYVEPVAPIQAPEKRLRLGDYITDKPNWMSEEYLDRTNNSAAVAEAQMATFWKSVGVDVDRSDRVAAATVGGAAAGAIGSGLAFGTVGALAGGTIGGNYGLGLGGVVSVPLAGIPGLPATVIVPTTVAGTAIGAAAGAAVLGIPAAVVGGIGGAAAAGAVGAGDTLAEPREIDIPNLPEPDADAITTQVSDQLAGQSPQVAQAVQDAVDTVPQVVEQVNTQAQAAREVVLAQPGGDQVINALDAAAVEANHAFSPAGDLIGQALGAVAAGVKA